MKFRVASILPGIAILCFMGNIYAQKKVVVMGSSTSAGTGASSFANSYVGKLTAYYSQNTNDNLDTVVTDIALGGTNTYNELQNGLAAVPNRPYPPDPQRNVDKALSFSPDVIIINLPTNDIASAYTPTEYMYNLRQMYSKIVSANVRCYITTTQPRNLPVPQRQMLRDLVDSIKNTFGVYSIDFWSDLVTGGDTNQIRAAVSAGDSIHVNDLGHNYLFIRVRDRQIFPSNGPLPIELTDFTVRLKNNTAIVDWRADMEEPNSYYEIQRSGGSVFTTLYKQTVLGRGAPISYSWTDQFPLDGQSFYRLKITEPSKESYSKTISILNKTADVDIRKLYNNSATALLNADIGIRKSQYTTIRIISAAGTLVQKQSIYITAPLSRIVLSTGTLSAGQYFLSVTTADNITATKPFSKQ